MLGNDTDIREVVDPGPHGNTKKKKKKEIPPGLKNSKRLTMSPNQSLLLIGGKRLQKIPRI